MARLADEEGRAGGGEGGGRAVVRGAEVQCSGRSGRIPIPGCGVARCTTMRMVLGRRGAAVGRAWAVRDEGDEGWGMSACACLCLCLRSGADADAEGACLQDTTSTEISVIESIFKLRNAGPSKIVNEMRSSLIESMQY